MKNKPDESKETNLNSADENDTQNCNKRHDGNNSLSSAKVLWNIWLAIMVFVTIIIFIIPESWYLNGICTSVTSKIGTLIPRIAYLARISNSPDLVLASYSLILLVTPIYAIFVICIFYLGIRDKTLKYQKIRGMLTSAWFFPFGYWFLFISCLLCSSDNPRDVDIILASGRVIIAIIVHGIAVLAAGGASAYLTYFIIIISNRFSR